MYLETLKVNVWLKYLLTGLGWGGGGHNLSIGLLFCALPIQYMTLNICSHSLINASGLCESVLFS